MILKTFLWYDAMHNLCHASVNLVYNRKPNRNVFERIVDNITPNTAERN